jgi:hypothetical protein
MDRKNHSIKSTTLLELIFAIILLSVVVLAIASIQVFSRYQVTSADRLAKVQNQVSLVVEHMNKNMFNAIGNMVNNPAYVISGSRISVRLDTNSNGQADAGDGWIAYQLSGNNLTYYPNAGGSGAPGGSSEVISPIITSVAFAPVAVTNAVQVDITGCLTPGSPITLDNPQVTLRTRIKLPAVSTN